ncbi:WD repeat domain 83 opposite strand [Paragonimus heterotremus]|uniref:WD repeat domain 83 opposite strand n=1 Tax=Paragonimus heterotremus TaxID=100268 RepID=A0A8J4T0V0_9TREM|nr:WD repeat domain 83 opposite strand [Paragonimus heterotremus]
MSNLTTADPRRPKKLRRFVPSSPDGVSADQTIDYLNFVGMILSMCGLLFEVKLAAWVAVACAFVTYANSRSGEDTKQLISGFMLSISALLICYMHNPQPMPLPW